MRACAHAGICISANQEGGNDTPRARARARARASDMNRKIEEKFAL